MRSVNASPQGYARLGGALYLAIILFGAFSEGFVTNKLLVAGDAAASARNILAAPGLWQGGVAANVLVVLLAVPLLWIEYLLLRPVSRSLALLSLLFNAVSLAVEAVSKVFLLLVMPTLANAGYRHAFGGAQVSALANMALKSHELAFNLALLFFGVTCLLNGYLIVQSGYLPKAVGRLLQVAGASYLLACWAALFAPALADVLLPGILLLPLLGESSFCLWLLIKGVDVAKWPVPVTPYRTASAPVTA
ncbi:DUF4386 domain-containing protein [Hymenobacter artigasi]|uniref:DUF4386 domain-containing protein n=1 Tax=Hymenobacter artigasi TaxID=2719616 RepID=A0ABX1HHF8_9BACT|nr:DUF4386 domain-containing protein [Hymenobacter artigasi]NKI88208.1 hypothetical protein [Hymenobacter artigasi]